MKEKLDSESRAAIVKYRLERAYETLKEADYNTAGGYYNAAVNRLYYACYYAASALLLNCEIEANTHNGVKTQLSMHFVRTGHLSLDHAQPLAFYLKNVRQVIIVTLHIVILLW